MAYIRILSTAGGKLTFENPWPGGASAGGRILEGRIISVDTEPGEKITITQA